MNPVSTLKPRVAVLVPATYKYTVFVPPILESFKRFFLVDCDVECIILTDLPARVDGRTFFIPHRPWPGVTLHKFHYLCQYEKELAAFDYVFVCDADMRVVAPVVREILGDLVATRHPGYYDKSRDDFPYERNPASAACIAPGAGSVYVMGAFFGGRFARVLAMAKDLSAAIDADVAAGIVSAWQDESYLNRYVSAHPPDTLLSPAYCYPEGSSLPFEPKILALDKDHDVIRSTGVRTWFVHGERIVRKVLGKAKSLVGRS